MNAVILYVWKNEIKLLNERKKEGMKVRKKERKKERRKDRMN